MSANPTDSSRTPRSSSRNSVRNSSVHSSGLDSDGIQDEVTVEDVIVTPLDRRDVYRYFWVINQVVLIVSAVVAVCAIVYGLAAGESESWMTGIGAVIISMLSVIGLLLARLGSDLKFAGRI